MYDPNGTQQDAIVIKDMLENPRSLYPHQVDWLARKDEIGVMSILDREKLQKLKQAWEVQDGE